MALQVSDMLKHVRRGVMLPGAMVISRIIEVARAQLSLALAEDIDDVIREAMALQVSDMMKQVRRGVMLPGAMAISGMINMARAPLRLAFAADIDDLSREAKFFARACDEAYVAPAQRADQLAGPGHGGRFAGIFQKCEEFEGDSFAVYVGENEGSPVIIAYRGTASLKDMMTDIKVVAHSIFEMPFTAEGKEAIHLAEHVATHFTDRSVHVTGHSLGGTLAACATMYAKPWLSVCLAGGHLFNPGAGTLSAVDLLQTSSEGSLGAQASARLSTLNVHHMWGDVISHDFPSMNMTTYRPLRAADMVPAGNKKGGSGAHMLSHFLR